MTYSNQQHAETAFNTPQMEAREERTTMESELAAIISLRHAINQRRGTGQVYYKPETNGNRQTCDPDLLLAECVRKEFHFQDRFGPEGRKALRTALDSLYDGR